MYEGLIIKKEKLNYFIWFVPFISLIIAGSLVYNTWYNKGPVVTLHLSKADGLEAGKTPIKSLNINVGKIISISLSKDLTSVVAKAQLDKEAEDLLLEDSVFWIQKPRFGTEGVTGLNTILSGYYIELSPGKKTGSEQPKSYDVLEDPPFDLNQPGVQIDLITLSSKELAVGDAVSFKGINAGFIYDKQYDFETNKLRYKAFVKQPYAKLVTPRSFFWINNGVSFSFGSEGLKVNTDTMQSMLKGGVSFDIPENFEANEKTVPNEYSFTLFDNRGNVETNYSNSVDFVVLTKGVSRGLVNDAPVFYRGIQVGVVKKAPYIRKNFEIFKDQEDDYAYLITIQAERFDKRNVRSKEELKNDIEKRLKKHDLSAVIENLSFITGRSYVNLVDVTDKQKTNSEFNSSYDGYTVIPSLENDFVSMQQSLAKLSQRLANIKVDELVNNLNGLLQNSAKTSKEITELCHSVRKLIEKMDRENVSQELIETLKETQKTLKSYNADSGLYNELHSTIKKLDDTLMVVEPVLKKIDQKSNSLVFEYKNSDPNPVAPQESK
ncbi:MAG: MlaD family protein [Succinivibrionaceae bacterium]|nr:MlaD family protein [Succinivibrionaceae bacterium]